jgi:hypothetical protein
MLLNISNHPYQSWSNKQKGAALKAYGEIIDSPFPQIPPDASSSEILELAQSKQKEIIAQFPSDTTVIHLMGEMTFSYSLIRLLQQEDYMVISSTTKRLIIEETDGFKTTQFKFQAFREYPKI